MTGISNYGSCCNRIIVSRQWRYCPFCGGPMTKKYDLGGVHMIRSEKVTYPELEAELASVSTDWESLNRLVHKLNGENTDLNSELQAGNVELKELEQIIAVAATDSRPRPPDIMIVDEDVPGVSGGLASVQEACGHLSTRGPNKDKPCIRPRENPEQTHAKGRHRYG